MGLFRKRRNVPFVTPEDVARYATKGPTDWGEMFSRDLADDDKEALELAFGEAGRKVINYLRDVDVTGRPTKKDMYLMAFGTTLAKAEFILRFRREYDPAVVESWRTEQLRSVDLDNYPGSGTPEPPRPSREELIAEAQDLVTDGWSAICFLVTAQMAKSVDVEGREVEFLRKTLGSPSEYRAAAAEL